MLQNEAKQCAEALFTLAERKPYVLEVINGYLICYIYVEEDEYSGFSEVLFFDLIIKKVLFYDRYVPNKDVVDILTGYLI